MTITFHSYGRGGTETTLELDERQSSIVEKLNEPTRLDLTLTSETAPMIALGAHITYQGVTYYVTSEPTVRKEHSKLFVVETELETSIGLARHVILSNPVDKRASFDYTATATEHLQLAIDSLNGKFAADRISWSRGAVNCKDTTKHLKYDGITVWEALQQIREAYETDIFVDGSTISLGREGDKSNALPLAYGKGKGLLSGLERLKHNDDTTPMCLYVTGTKRNMTTGRLTLERSQLLKVTDTGTIQRNPTDLDGQIYTTDSTGQRIADYSADNVFDALYTEAVYTNEEIYPSHVSTIKTVTKVQDHFEVNSDLDYSKLRIDGEQMQVVFQTGNLAGRDFDANYYPSTGRIAIVPKEEDDTTLPNDTLCPKVGDQYIVTGIKLPSEYIKEAQRKLTDEALRHLVKLQRQRYSYKAEIDPVYLHNNHDKIAPQLTVGRYVHLTDPHIAVGNPYIRIVGKRTYLDRPYQPEIELSNEVEPPSLLASILDQIDNSSLLERLRNDMKGVEHLSVSINNLTSDATDIKRRLEGAEGAIDNKLDRSAFDSWETGDYSRRLSDIYETLAGKQAAGSYALTSELATSQQQAVAEAVKQAGALDDKQAEEYKKLLAGKQAAGNYALSSELESHKRATDKSFEALANHPLAVDKDGYWRIWSVKDNQYVTTQYPSRGQAGADGKDAGRYLGRAKRIHPDFNGNYLLEPEGSSWQTAKEGDYVYLVGDLSNRGGDKDTYYIVREHKSKTVWEVYDIKGRSPEVYLGSDNYLYVDGVKQRYLKGDPGDNGEAGHSPEIHVGEDDYLYVDGVKQRYIRGQQGEAGHTPELHVGEDDYLYVDGIKQRYIRGRQGEPGDSPSPEDVVRTSAFAERLSAKIEESEKIKSLEVDVRDAKQTATTSAQEVAGFGQELVRTKGLAQASYELSNDANASAADLSKRSLTADQRDEVAYLTSALPQLRSADGRKKLQALALQRYITLSSNGDSISAYLASDALTAVLKAGITNFGKPEEKENVAINHNGTGHFGNLYFEGNQIDFRIDQKTDPYLSVGATEANFIDNFLNSARVDNTPVSIRSTTLPDRNKLPDSSAYTLKRTFSVTNEGTRITISIDSLKVETYKPNKASLVLDEVVLDTWQGHVSTGIVRLPDGTIETNPTPVPYTASNLIYERTLSKGTHMIQIILESPNSSDKVTLSGVKVRQRYDTGLQQSLLTKSGLRLFGSPDRYLDVDYRKQYYNETPGSGVMIGWVNNPYTVRVKGGAKVDKITADELDMPGVPLCGASFDASGSQVKAFGKKAKRQGYNQAQAVYYDSGRFFRVYHSIGHTNYLPTVQVIGDNGNDINWNLTARIYAVNANDFAVRIITNGDNPIKHAFSFVAFKTM